MPFVETQQFGRLEYDPATEIEFPQGIPGFEAERRFVVVQTESLAPVVFLQSAVSPGLCFTTVPVQDILPAYELELNSEDHALLGEAPTLVALAILSAAPGGTLTANLLAPLVINLPRNVGIQAVRCDSKYPHAYPLGDACS